MSLGQVGAAHAVLADIPRGRRLLARPLFGLSRPKPTDGFC